MYRLYGKHKIKGYEKIDVKADKEEIIKEGQALSSKDYYSYMIIENNGQGDNVIVQESLFEKCKVEYVAELKSKIEVKATTFRPTKMKKKEELRKLTEQYIER